MIGVEDNPSSPHLFAGGVTGSRITLLRILLKQVRAGLHVSDRARPSVYQEARHARPIHAQAPNC